MVWFFGRRLKEHASQGPATPRNLRRVKLKIGGMTCGGCASNIEGLLKRQKGVVEAKVDFSLGSGTVLYDALRTSKEEIRSSPIFKEPSAFTAEVAEEGEA